MILSSTVTAIELKIEKLSSGFASFNCDDLVNGIVHVPSKDKVTVILDGGFLLGEYCCLEEAILNISRLITKIKLAEMTSGITYKAYQAAFKSGQSLTKH
ncbi:hypothetical protein GKC68_10520 [Pantoea sp. RSPAM1]|uniref:hypothetical protein n=1 Tax=Pantoea sp. RSPAM1 TaxID=2675223 RepID=UPI00315DD64E